MCALGRALATLFAPPFLGVAAAPPFLPAFLEGAWRPSVSDNTNAFSFQIADHYANEILEVEMETNGSRRSSEVRYCLVVTVAIAVRF